ncbi:MAG: Nramp family divalent metal transporter [bacterium]
MLRQIFSREILRYIGPAFLVTVGFIDPGNWATNIAGGSEFNYSLLWVITLSTLMLILLQTMSARLGIVTNRSLADLCRTEFHPAVSSILGITIILASIATALAEFLGAAIGLYLLFGIPVWLAGILSSIIVLFLIGLQRYGHSVIEHIIIGFVSIIGFAYLIELYLVKPDWSLSVYHSFIPSLEGKSILVAMGMLGAVVMPHNIYLHSSVVRHIDFPADEKDVRKLFRFELVDTILAMGVGWLINSAMIIVAAAVFFRNGIMVNSIEQASLTLQPLVGDLARVLFGIALLCSGLSSSTTASLAGANVFTGYLNKSKEYQGFWFQLGMAVTIIPALIIIALNLNAYQVLIISQVVLSIQLPFTMIPLLLLTNRKQIMGVHANNFILKLLAGLAIIIIIGLNAFLLWQLVF